MNLLGYLLIIVGYYGLLVGDPFFFLFL